MGKLFYLILPRVQEVLRYSVCHLFQGKFMKFLWTNLEKTRTGGLERETVESLVFDGFKI